MPRIGNNIIIIIFPELISVKFQVHFQITSVITVSLLQRKFQLSLLVSYQIFSLTLTTLINLFDANFFHSLC